MTQRLPNALMLGAAKSGTTTLADRLNQHPKIHLSDPKEPEYFSHQEKWDLGLDWYHGCFEGASDDALLLDASTGYTRHPQHPDAPARIAQACPDAKLIYLMRHPVDRAYSHFVHRHMKELRPGEPFDRDFDAHAKDDPMVVDSSDYRLQIGRYLEHFPASSMLLLFTHEMKADETALLQRTCAFLGIGYEPAHFEEKRDSLNVASEFREIRARHDLAMKVRKVPGMSTVMSLIPGSVKQAGYNLVRKSPAGKSKVDAYTPPPLSDEARARLLERYAAMTDWLEERTGADLSAWRV